MDLYPERWRYRDVGQKYDPGLVVPPSHGRNGIPSGGMGPCILDHHAAHVVGDDDCNDDAERRALWLAKTLSAFEINSIRVAFHR